MTDDERVIYETRMALHEGLKRQNEKLIKALKFYADPESWTARGIAREDRGELARKTVASIWQVDLWRERESS